MNSTQLTILILSAVVFVIIILFLAWLFYQKSRNTERLLLIEKGASPADLVVNQRTWKNMPWKIIGFTSIGLGLGLFLMYYSGPHYKGDYSYFYYGLPVFFGGIGMVLGNLKGKSKRSTN